MIFCQRFEPSSLNFTCMIACAVETKKMDVAVPTNHEWGEVQSV